MHNSCSCPNSAKSHKVDKNVCEAAVECQPLDRRRVGV